MKSCPFSLMSELESGDESCRSVDDHGVLTSGVMVKWIVEAIIERRASASLASLALRRVSKLTR